MKQLVVRCFLGAALWVALGVCCPRAAAAADSLDWNTSQDRVTADIKSSDLLVVLKRIAAATGWKVYVEPETLHNVSAKFKDLPSGKALPFLLGDVNFALVPATNSSPKLFVFRTTMQRATQLIQPVKAAGAEGQAKLIPNELIVRLKPGAKIDDVARLLGAKVVGKIDSLNAYRLRFDDQAAADAAREQLAANPDVAAVDSNYSFDRPLSPRQVLSGGVPGPPSLQLKPPPDSGRVIVGLVDTAVQPMGNGLDSFMLKQLSVAGAAELDPSSPSHGTSMAETVLRSLQSITKGNTSVQILPVDVYGSNPTTSTFDVANGIVTAVNNGANPINLSLGSEGNSPFLHDVIQQASSHNIVFVGAAGNTPVTTPFYPAAYPEVMAVTAVDQGQIAPYANRGSFVTVGAPGTSVVWFQNQPYDVTGTSTSAALTSGLVAGYADATHSTIVQASDVARARLALKPAPGK